MKIDNNTRHVRAVHVMQPYILRSHTDEIDLERAPSSRSVGSGPMGYAPCTNSPHPREREESGKLIHDYFR